MKTIRYLVGVVVVFSFLSTAQSQIVKEKITWVSDGSGNYTTNTALEVPDGEVWELLQVTGSGQLSRLQIVSEGVVELEIFLPVSSAAPSLSQWNGLRTLSSSTHSVAPDLRRPMIVGPATVQMIVLNQGGPHPEDSPAINAEPDYTKFLTYRKIVQNSPVSSVPANTVVIPTDANGPVEVIMESSVDLVNWTAATPGSYGASTEKRFFRLRAVTSAADSGEPTDED